MLTTPLYIFEFDTLDVDELFKQYNGRSEPVCFEQYKHRPSESIYQYAKWGTTNREIIATCMILDEHNNVLYKHEIQYVCSNQRWIGYLTLTTNKSHV